MIAAIQTAGLTKDFGAARGLFDLDLEVHEGEVFGYLGPNGAGKSTTIRLLMGFLHPTRGSGRIFDLDCTTQAVDVKRHVGYAPADVAQFGGLRGNAIVAAMAGLRGGADEAFVRQFCERFDLDLGRRFREYSSGNKRKLAILLAFMHRPRLLILDEPTAGLDPLNQQEFYALVREARDGGATVFLSSHVLSEVEHISDRVAIIRRGKLVRVAKLEDLHEMRLHEVEIEVGGTVPEAAIRAAAGVDDVVVEGNHVRCTVRGSFQPLLRALESAEVVNLISREPSLEEVFLADYRDQPDSELAPGTAGPVA